MPIMTHFSSIIRKKGPNFFSYLSYKYLIPRKEPEIMGESSWAPFIETDYPQQVDNHRWSDSLNHSLLAEDRTARSTGQRTKAIVVSVKGTVSCKAGDSVRPDSAVIDHCSTDRLEQDNLFDQNYWLWCTLILNKRSTQEQLIAPCLKVIMVDGLIVNQQHPWPYEHL